MIIYRISLPKTTDADAFAAFMKDEYFPSIHKGPTRVGLVTSLLLLQSKDSDSKHQFLWQVGWSGLSGRDPHTDDDNVQKKFETFGAKLHRLGTYDAVASWREKQAG